MSNRCDECGWPKDTLRIIWLVVLLLSMPCISMASISESTLKKQRTLFLQAKQMIRQGHNHQLQRVIHRLKNYPLTPYLYIWQARKQLHDGHDQAIPALLARYIDVPEIRDLHIAWIRYLVKHQKWHQAKAQFDALSGNHRRLQKEYLRTLWHVNEKDAAALIVSERWLSGKRIHTYQHDMLLRWIHHGHPTRMERWARIRHQVSRRHWRAARRTARHLNRADRVWFKYWDKAHRHLSAHTLATWKKDAQQEPQASILQYMLYRLARKDALGAWEFLHQYRTLLGEDHYHLLKRKIALRAAKQHLPDAAHWLGSIRPEDRNTRVWGWQTRIYLLMSNWQAALDTIQNMPPAMQLTDRWHYWQARCLMSLGQKKQAMVIFASLTQSRGYHNFLSAAHLGSTHQMHDHKVTADPVRLMDLLDVPGIQRAHEWLNLSLPKKAMREWYAILGKRKTSDWQLAAARLAASWQWYDQAIRAAHRGAANDDMTLRFPLAFYAQVKKYAKRSDVSESLMMAVIRQESAFDVQAKSSVGAMGLMQLMPTTASHVSRKHKLGTRMAKHLWHPAANIRIGAFYLADLLKRFDGNAAMAVAAYNAGHTRILRWRANAPENVDMEAWVEAIPFRETRRYVQQVLAFSVVYHWRLKQKVGNILTMLKPVHATGKEG